MQHTEVEVSPRDVVWFGMNRAYPVLLQVAEDHVIFADKKYRLYRAPGDGFHVACDRSVLGTFDQHGVRRAPSAAARRELKAIRAAVLRVPYEVPLAYEIKQEGRRLYVHPGKCLAVYSGAEPRAETSVRTRALHSVKGDKRCVVCSEGFE